MSLFIAIRDNVIITNIFKAIDFLKIMNYINRNTEMKSIPGNSLGVFLKAARNMFFYSEVHQAYLRMRWIDEEKGLLEVESCPPREISERTGRTRHKDFVEYIAWSEDHGVKRRILSALPLTNQDSLDYKVLTIRLIENKFEIV